MGYATLQIRKDENTRKYILFYADYLQEAWLSEVNNDGTTTIVSQYNCRNIYDFNKLIKSLSKFGEVINLISDATVEQQLNSLELKLEKSWIWKLRSSLFDLQNRVTDGILSYLNRPTAA